MFISVSFCIKLCIYIYMCVCVCMYYYLSSSAAEIQAIPGTPDVALFLHVAPRHQNGI